MKNEWTIVAVLFRASCSFLIGDKSLIVRPPDEITRASEPTEGVTVNPASLFHETTTFFLADNKGFGFSHDGKSVLARPYATGIFNALTLRANGSPTPLTNSLDAPLLAQSFFPNDDRVLLQDDQGENEQDHVFVLESNGVVRDVTPGDGLKASFLSWHRDGDYFYVTTNECDLQSNDIYS